MKIKDAKVVRSSAAFIEKKAKCAICISTNFWCVVCQSLGERVNILKKKWPETI